MKKRRPASSIASAPGLRSGITSTGRTHHPEQANTLKASTTRLLLLTCLIALSYALYSLVSNGLYQHDEAGHFLNMRAFWYEPSLILGNWPKTGFKLLFAPVALLGPTAVLVANCLVSALCCYFSYRLAEAVGSRLPLLTFLFLALQPFWLQMSFRCYPEALAGLILLVALLSHYRGRFLLAALLVSYLTIIRQELYLLLLLYGIYLLYRRRLVPALALALFPVMYHIWGWAATGDPLFLINQLILHSANIQTSFPRHGFNHYFLMSLTIFGALNITFLVVYFGQVLFYRRRVHWFILVPMATYFLTHSFFNLTSINIGPATGGSLRYLTLIAPLMAVLATIAAEQLVEIRGFKAKYKLYYLLAPLLLAVYLFMRYKHNNIGFTGETDYFPVITTLTTIAVVTLASNKKFLIAALIVCNVCFTAMMVRPIKPSSEDLIMKRAATWAKVNDIISSPVLVDHPMFFYYLGMSRQEFAQGALDVTSEHVNRARSGTKILWDSHYSYRPELKHDQIIFKYFFENPDQFQIMTEPRLFSDEKFWLLVFEKK